MAKIVVLGGGFAGVNAVKILAKKLDKNEHAVSLISKNSNFIFSPLLHEVAAGFLNENEIIQPINKIIKRKNFEFAQGDIIKIDFEKKSVHTSIGEVSYDYLLIAMGSMTNLAPCNKISKKEKFYSVKTLEDSIEVKTRLNELAAKYVESKNAKKEIHILFIGAGATAIEVACEVSDFFNNYFTSFGDKNAMEHIKIQLLEKSDKILPNTTEEVRQAVTTKLLEKNIEIIYNSKFINFEMGKAEIEMHGENKKLGVSMLFLAAGVIPSKIEYENGSNTLNIKTDKDYFEVDEFLQVKNLENVWAAGDIAKIIDPITNNLIPMLAQSAKASGKSAAENVVNKIKGKKQTPFSFKLKGFLISLGQANALGTINNKLYSGKMVWLIKRTIYSFEFFTCTKKLSSFWNFTIKGLFRKKF